jgi:hypothetical protein
MANNSLQNAARRRLVPVGQSANKQTPFAIDMKGGPSGGPHTQKGNVVSSSSNKQTAFNNSVGPGTLKQSNYNGSKVTNGTSTKGAGSHNNGVPIDERGVPKKNLGHGKGMRKDSPLTGQKY